MEEGVKGLLSSMSFKQPSLSLLAPYSFLHPKEINQTAGGKKGCGSGGWACFKNRKSVAAAVECDLMLGSLHGESGLRAEDVQF